MTCIHVLQLCEPVVHPVIGFNSLFVTFTFTFYLLLLPSYNLNSVVLATATATATATAYCSTKDS